MHDKGMANVTQYHPNVHALKGLAPTAKDFNLLAENLEYLNTRKIPRAALLTVASNTTINIANVGGIDEAFFDYDTLQFDNASMWTGSQLNAPSDATFIRIVFNVVFTAVTNKDFHVTHFEVTTTEIDTVKTGIFNFERAFNIGYGATNAGITQLNYDSGWHKISVGTDLQQIVFRSFGGSFVIKTDPGTWLSVEVI
jgi:hypothetical protein